MYNFKMLKKEQDEIIDNCNLTETQRFIFDNLVKGKSRLEIYDMARNKYNISQSTVSRQIRKIVKIVNEFKSDGGDFKHKVYIHKFPNGKKYVGVCQCCEDRWRSGQGYAYNEDMYKDIKKYGWDNIEHKILLEVSDNKLAYEIERVLIEELDLINKGYNRE